MVRVKRMRLNLHGQASGFSATRFRQRADKAFMRRPAQIPAMLNIAPCFAVIPHLEEHNGTILKTRGICW
jgi:hypothetical protein